MLSAAKTGSAKKLSALLLAAGKSSRAREFKPLLNWSGETFLAKVFRSLKESHHFEEILVITGHRSSELEAPLHDIGASFSFNPHFETGMQSSIQHGLKSLTLPWDGVLIALVDQPHWEAQDYAQIADAYLNSALGLLRPAHQDRFGNPAVIASRYLPEILAEPATDRGCAYLFSRHPEDAGVIEMPDDRCLHDFDSEEDLKTYLKRLKPN